MRFLIVGVMMVAGMVAAGCQEHSTVPARDFNELIPRLMKPVNTYDDPITAAANLFNVTSPDERRDAIAYLSPKPYGHEPAYMKAYYLLTTDPHAMVRAQAMRALGASHQQEAVPYLINGNAPSGATGVGKTGLSDPDVQVRRDAARGLMETFNDTAIPAVADCLLKDTDDQVRVTCAQALQNAHTPEAYRALIGALDDRDAAVVYHAHLALVANTGQDLGYNAKPWLEWHQKTYVKAATQSTP
ncbi:MAG: HEAT repeat domain-containing protein [Phycisphaerales bacterium]|nr:HEAT repeat domain-containing protein [Phycisphaerales bacterium]